MVGLEHWKCITEESRGLGCHIGWEKTRDFRHSPEKTQDRQRRQCEQSGGVARLLDTQTSSELNSSKACVPPGPIASVGRDRGSEVFLSSPGLAGT